LSHSFTSNSAHDWSFCSRSAQPVPNSEVYEGRRRTPLVDQQLIPTFATARRCIDQYTEFCRAISTRFCFICLLGGVTAMPRGATCTR